MADFDTISKTHARAYPMDFVNHCLDFEQGDVTFVQLITPEQPTIEMHQADMLIKVDLNGEEALIHFEFQSCLGQFNLRPRNNFKYHFGGNHESTFYY